MGKRARPQRPPPTPPKLLRPSGTLPVRKAVFIACEGLTEESYFWWYAREHRASGVMVQVVGQLGDPRNVVEHALAHKKLLLSNARRERDSYTTSVETWAVVDVDEHTRLPEARVLAEANGVGLAISNPCFELWALLPFADQTAWIHRHVCQRRLAEEMPVYHHDDAPILDARLMRDREAEARRRVALLDQRHQSAGTSGGNPSTSIPRLCDLLRGSTSPDDLD